MKKIVLTISLILFCAPNLLSQAGITQEEYAVYASVLRDIYKDNRQIYSNKSHFVILKNTKIDPELDLTPSKRYKGLVAAFKRANLTSGIIERKFPLGAYSETYYLVTKNEIDELFEKGKVEFDKRYEIEKNQMGLANPGGTTWIPFYEKYPEASGYYSLSRVGFNGLFAMVQVKRDDIHSGFTRTYILKKVKGKWKIVTLLSSSEWVT
jgi:hypothetical protein